MPKTMCEYCQGLGKIFIPAAQIEGRIVDEIEEDCVCSSTEEENEFNEDVAY